MSGNSLFCQTDKKMYLDFWILFSINQVDNVLQLAYTSVRRLINKHELNKGTLVYFCGEDKN